MAVRESNSLQFTQEDS